MNNWLFGINSNFVINKKNRHKYSYVSLKVDKSLFLSSKCIAVQEVGAINKIYEKYIEQTHSYQVSTTAWWKCTHNFYSNISAVRS